MSRSFRETSCRVVRLVQGQFVGFVDGCAAIFLGDGEELVGESEKSEYLALRSSLTVTGCDMQSPFGMLALQRRDGDLSAAFESRLVSHSRYSVAACAASFLLLSADPAQHQPVNWLWNEEMKGKIGLVLRPDPRGGMGGMMQ